MSYETVERFRARLPEADLVRLTDFDGSGEVDDDRIAAALEDATAEINSYIAKVVTLPLTHPPRHLAVICRDLALHRLYVNIGHDMEAQQSLRADAIGYLKKVAAGDIALGDAPGGTATLTSPGVAMTSGPERRMTRDSLRGF